VSVSIRWIMWLTHTDTYLCYQYSATYDLSLLSDARRAYVTTHTMAEFQCVARLFWSSDTFPPAHPGDDSRLASIILRYPPLVLIPVTILFHCGFEVLTSVSRRSYKCAVVALSVLVQCHWSHVDIKQTNSVLLTSTQLN